MQDDKDGPGRYQLKGAIGSPYSMKMRAALRYRCIPFDWEGGMAGFVAAQSMKAKVIPVLVTPEGEVFNDSTALIALLEARHPGARSLVPSDPALAFLSLLLEDLADEWLVKAMYAYRWARPVDQEQMSRWLAFDALRGSGQAVIEEQARVWRDRQVGRLDIVGVGGAAQPVIEASAGRIMAALDRQVVERGYLLGSRPCAADFAFYGQLSQLTTDPTPQALMRAHYPWLFRWVQTTEDLSGEPEGQWDAALDTPVLHALLTECATHYLPFLAANAAAVQSGEPLFCYRAGEAELAQPADRYQVKCLRALVEAYASLDRDSQTRLRSVLAGTGCLSFLTEAASKDVAA
ncbi:MAG: glutathione S-transferase [Caulobacteraceae bacterium]|nr:glutathione S-transferase [Caulobacteraceae bacterium]